MRLVPLSATLSNDLDRMAEQGKGAGLVYVCNPNNPSGTATPRKDIEYLLANKKSDAVVVLDDVLVPTDR